MAKVIFDYNNQKIEIQCKIEDSLSKICQTFGSKINYDINKLIFLYAGEKLNLQKTFKEQANSFDASKKEMNVLAYKIEDDETKQIENKSDLDPKFEEEVEKIKDKLNNILNKFLADRKYVKDKITNWRDAIMKECETFFSSYSKEYTIFTNLIIYDKSEKKSHFSNTKNAFGAKKRFKVIFKSNNIAANMMVTIFEKNIKKRKKIDIKDVFENIQKNFLNLAECRTYEIFLEKYWGSFEKEFEELIGPYKKDLFFFYQVSNNHYNFSTDFKIFNPEKEDYYLSKIINTDECTLTIVFGKKQ